MPLLRTVEVAARSALSLRGIRGRFRATRHGTLHLYDGVGRGPLPPAVCLHGLASSSASFARLLALLQDHCRRVIAVDLPGHGHSPVPPARLSVHRLLDAIDELLLRETNEPVLLIGNSLGGGLALRFALTHPERVRALTLMSPAGAALEAAELRNLLRTFRFDSLRQGRAFFRRLYHQSPPMSSLFAWDLRRTLERPHLRELIGALEEAEPFSVDELRELPHPLLLMWGKSDRLMPKQALGYFRQHLPETCVIRELDGVGHSPHVEAPAQTLRHFLDFARVIDAK